MASSISVGVVYSNKDLVDEFENLLQFISTNEIKLIKVSFCHSVDGTDWEEIYFSENPQKNILLNKFLFSFDFQLFISCHLFGRKNLNCVIKVEHCRDYFGFLLEFDERELIKVHNTETLNKLTQSIVDFISKLFLYSKFDYAFCDHDVEIEYSPECIRTKEEGVYSLLLLPKLDLGEEKLQIILSSWHIDGHTTREVKK